jgi:hypothetical protein
MLSVPSQPVYVTHHFYGVTDRGELPFETGNWRNGLVSVMSVGARIHTGLDTGNVNVMTVIRYEAPEEIDEASWDEIVEVSVHSEYGELRVDSPHSGAVFSLPVLSTNGPGSYRLRVHARGRDANLNGITETSTEDHLLIIWPSAPAPEVVVRLTDDCGYSMRLSAAKTEQYREPPVQVAVDPRQQRKDQLRQAILDGIAKAPSSPE